MEKLKSKDTIIICKVLLVVAITFWTYVFIDYAITILKGTSINYYVAIILFFESILHFFVYLAIVKKYKVIYFIGTILIGLNAFLSMGGQMGLIDIIAVGLSVLLLLFLSISSKTLFINTK